MKTLLSISAVALLVGLSANVEADNTQYERQQSAHERYAQQQRNEQQYQNEMRDQRYRNLESERRLEQQSRDNEYRRNLNNW